MSSASTHYRSSIVVFILFFAFLSTGCDRRKPFFEWTGTWEEDLRPGRRPVWKGNQLLRVSDGVAEAVFLYGAYNNGRHEENIRIEKRGDEIVLQAWWMDLYGSVGVWSLKQSLKPEELKKLWKTLLGAKAFGLTDEAKNMSHAMAYWLEVKKGARHHRARVYGVGWFGSTTEIGGARPIDRDWFTVVFSILDLRKEYAHRIRPARFAKDGSVEDLPLPRGILYTDELARKESQAVKAKPEWEKVLLLGTYRNRIAVETLHDLLDHEDVAVREAACAGLSWASGLPPNPDKAAWKAWWKEAGDAYKPRSTPWPFEGEGEGGTIRRLGGGLSGFVGVELDEDGHVWALSEIEGDGSGKTYRVYRLDEEKETFIETPLKGRLDNPNLIIPPTRFVRLMAEKKIPFAHKFQSIWAAPGGRWAAAVVGEESQYHSDAVKILDFAQGKVSRPYVTDHQYGGPVVSSDGKHIAVAKAWNWANPNEVVVIETESGEERVIPIPKAEGLGAIAYLKDSPKGEGFYFVRQEGAEPRNRGPLELWWSDPAGKTAGKIFTKADPGHFAAGGTVTVTGDGRRFFVQKARTEDGARVWTGGWMALPEGTYEEILPPGVHPMSLSSNPEGSRLVFVHSGQVFEWQGKK